MSKKRNKQPRLPSKIETLQDVFNVQDYFKGNGVFNEWLADAGVSVQTIWKWKTGKCSPNVRLEGSNRNPRAGTLHFQCKLFIVRHSSASNKNTQRDC